VEINKDIKIESKRLVLKSFTEVDVTIDYVKWMNDYEVNRYLESRGMTHSEESIKEWVAWTNKDESRILLGIFKDDIHIGNVTFYYIEPTNRCLRFSISIGRKDMWGKAYGPEAMNAAVNYALEEMAMHRVESGILPMNKGSIAMFKKCGFHHEATFKDRVVFEGKFEDVLFYVRINTEN
jgi:RimJ/RimL family protein N-acetyltransferase